MDRLSIVISIMTGSVLGGAVVVTAFSLGFYSVYAIAAAALISILLSWPLSYLLSRQIKQHDPNWHKPKPKPKVVPDPSAPEV